MLRIALSIDLEYRKCSKLDLFHKSFRIVRSTGPFRPTHYGVLIWCVKPKMLDVHLKGVSRGENEIHLQTKC